ncbi:MAG: CARDB domain-containing protein [Myxococcota bacterium]
MLHRITTLLAVLLLAPSAFAASRPDLTVDVTGPASAGVYANARYDVEVSNIGNKDAANVSLEIALPETNTSPNTYVMGIVGAKSSACSQSGTRLLCSLGTIKKFKSKAVYFDIALPFSAVALIFDADVSTTTSESNLANNSGSLTANVTYVPTAIGAPRNAVNSHCTGHALTGFYECVVSPGSQMSHNITFLAGGGIDFPDFPGMYTGAWSQPTPDSLVFEYLDGATPFAQFAGNGVGGNCFEGITTFPLNPTWNSAYQVCLQ